MLLPLLTAREGRLSGRCPALPTPTNRRAAPKNQCGFAVVCLCIEAGARSSVKTGEYAALSNRR